MKKNIFYWSPCINPLELKSTLNSAIALSKFNKIIMLKSLMPVEWNNHKNIFEKIQ